MTRRPLFLLRRPTLQPRSKGRAVPRSGHLPGDGRQVERLGPRFELLERAFAERRLAVQATPMGISPDEAIVFETVGSVENFRSQVRRIQGFEWLAEIEEDDVPPDEDFYVDEQHRDSPMNGRVYLVLSNQQALQQMLSLWKRFTQDPNGSWWGKTPWRDLFRQLHDIRVWDVQDRLLETGALDDWLDQLHHGAGVVQAEAELWYRADPVLRSEAEHNFEALVGQEQGRIITSATIPEIEYHGILFELPGKAVESLSASPDTALVRTGSVMFFRPAGQLSARVPDNSWNTEEHRARTSTVQEGPPVIALLDGVPLANHVLLSAWMMLDDPDDLARTAPVRKRKHGTTMASLIVHGDLDQRETPLSRRLYVRPILQPEQDYDGDVERIPTDRLAVDVIHEAVRRMFEGEPGIPASAPEVRIINVAIGDEHRPFDRMVSPLARLVDWLSWHYNVLFIISAGNRPSHIELDHPRDEFSTLSREDLQGLVVEAVVRDVRDRRLLSPGEALNAITVGALHSDSSDGQPPVGRNVDPYLSNVLPSPISAVGPGFRRSVKPELLLPGGRQPYLERLGNTHNQVVLDIHRSASQPGVLAACPGSAVGEINYVSWVRGTSVATAMASRYAGRILEDLLAQADGISVDDRYLPVLVKALLIHTTTWSEESQQAFETALKTRVSGNRTREHVGRFLGYGSIDGSRLVWCTDQRATGVSVASIGEDQSHVYMVPLPPSLRGLKQWRRLTVTLAWLTPTVSHHRDYRCAALQFNLSRQVLSVDRQDYDHNAVKRGTVQHEILEGERASIFGDDDSLEVTVSARRAAGDVLVDVPYALVVSLEVAEDLELPVYDEVLTRIRQPVGVAG